MAELEQVPYPDGPSALPFVLGEAGAWAAASPALTIADDGLRDALASLTALQPELDAASHALADAETLLQRLHASQQELLQHVLLELAKQPPAGASSVLPIVGPTLPFPLGAIEELSLPSSLRRRGVRVRLLGRFEVDVDGKRLTAWRSRRARQLFAYLLLNRGDDVSRHRLMGLFWPDHSEERAENNLSLAVLALRRLLDAPGGGPSLIAFRAGCYAIDADDLWVDADAFSATVARAQALEAASDLAGAASALGEALDLYGGDLLPGELYEDWTQTARQRLQDVFATALRQRASLARRAGDGATSVRLQQRLLDLDPADEAAHRQLMRDYLALGQRSRAVAQAEACVAVLQRQLGVAPDAETQAVIDQVRHSA